MVGQRHEPGCTSQTAMESGSDLSPGGYVADQGMGHINREGQGAEGWDLASGGKLCEDGGRLEVSTGCTTSRAQ